MPPIAKPIATSMSWRKIRATNSTTPTMAIVVYWRRRYAEAPSWTAADRLCIVSLPGDSASSDRVVSSAVDHGEPGARPGRSTTPWSDQEIGQGNPSGIKEASRRAQRTRERTKAAAAAGPPLERGGVYRRGGGVYCPGTQRRPERLRRARALGLVGRARRRPRRSGAPRRPAAPRPRRRDSCDVGHLQLRQRVAHRAELLAVARLEQRQQRARGVDRLLDLRRSAWASCRSARARPCGRRG